jgi:hypothetical protein
MSLGWQPPPASLTPADGPLGATDVQEALDLIAAAGPFYTTESTASIALVAAPAWKTIKTFTISAGTQRHLRAEIDLNGGTIAAPTAATLRFIGTARRTNGGTVTASTGLSSVDQSGINPSVNWVVSGGTVLLQLRATGAPTVRLTLRYNWLEGTPP